METMETQDEKKSGKESGRAGTPLKTAAALSYEAGMPAPRITASGKGRTAERIMATAVENGVTVVEDSFLADILERSPVGSFIPEKTYRAVAVIFSFLERTKKEKWF